MNTESKPAASAVQENSSSSLGPNCSADALYPIRSNTCSCQSSSYDLSTTSNTGTTRSSPRASNATLTFCPTRNASFGVPTILENMRKPSSSSMKATLYGTRFAQYG